ncbi:circadian locomoter output cycles protein kaput-like isoform X3 [Vespula maculifrons]|uniref:Circadian locomoter output cycles protein kaput-like isoform X3 n=1 Tax=Vespula maculifrons TaxID=7453 RepID=A0ABD2CRJ9_VESMC
MWSQQQQQQQQQRQQQQQQRRQQQQQQQQLQQQPRTYLRGFAFQHPQQQNVHLSIVGVDDTPQHQHQHHHQLQHHTRGSSGMDLPLSRFVCDLQRTCVSLIQRELSKKRQQEDDSIGSAYPSYGLIRAVTPATSVCNAIHVTCASHAYRLFLISRILVEEFGGPLVRASTLMIMRFNNKTFHDVIHFLCTPRDIIDFGMRQFAAWG